MPTHHEIEITVAGKRVRQPAKMPDLAVGDTVHYFSKTAGKVIIRFPKRSPFQPGDQIDTSVTGEESHTIRQAGRFQSGCQVELPDGKKTVIGWDPRDPTGTKDSGGDHDVRKPNP